MSAELIALLNPKPQIVNYADLAHGVYDIVKLKSVTDVMDNQARRSVIVTLKIGLNAYDMWLPAYIEKKISDEIIKQMKNVSGQWQITKSTVGIYWSIKNDMHCSYCNAIASVKKKL